MMMFNGKYLNHERLKLTLRSMVKLFVHSIIQSINFSLAFMEVFQKNITDNIWHLVGRLESQSSDEK